MLSYLQQCASMHALHKTLFSDVKRQTRWGQVTLLSHLIIKSWPLQHISLHSGTRRKNLTSCNNCIWQLVGREWHREVVLDNICIRPGQLTRWKQKCFPHSAGSCAPAPSCCWMFVNWHSVDSLGTMNHTLHSPLSTLHSGQFRTWCPGRATGHCLPVRAFVAAGSSGYKYHNYSKQRAVQASHQGLSECPVLASRPAGQQGTGGGQVSVFGPGVSTSNKQSVCLWTHL